MKINTLTGALIILVIGNIVSYFLIQQMDILEISEYVIVEQSVQPK